MVYIYVVSAGFPQVFRFISTVKYAEKGHKCSIQLGKHRRGLYRSKVMELNRVKTESVKILPVTNLII